MKILFDNNVPVPLRHRLPGHEVTTSAQLGWADLKNGALMARAEEAGYELLISGDKNIPAQNRMAGRKLAVLFLGTTRWQTLREDTGPILAAIDRARPGEYEQMPKPPRTARSARRPRGPRP